jgi:hypothetical protein
MAAHDVVTTQAALVAAALRLVDDHPDMPAGSVLRCFSRAVVVTRRRGVPHDVVPERAFALAHQLLAARADPGARTPRALVEVLGAARC